MKSFRRAVVIALAGASVLASASAWAPSAGADTAVQVQVADTAVVKPTTGTASMSFPIKLLHASHNPVRINWSTSDGSAVAGRDYTATSGSTNISPGSLYGTATVPVLGNTLDTGSRSFYLNLASATYGTIVDGQAVGVIQSNSPRPYITVDDTATTVGYTGTGSESFTVSLSAASANTVSVRYQTSDGSARAGINYTSQAGTLTFAPGVTTQTVSVPVTGKVAPEARWYFALNLNAATNASIQDSTGYAYINDNDRVGYLTVDDQEITKPASGSSVVNVPVRLVAPVTFPVTADYNTSDSSAVSGTDYTGTTGTVTFPAGTTSQTVPVSIAGSAANNAPRSFNVTVNDLSAGATILRSTGVVTIESSASLSSVLSVRDAGMAKPTSGTANEVFTVTAQPASATPITFSYTTANSSASAGIDFTATSGTGTIPANAGSTTISVPVLGNTSVQGDTTFSLNISGNSSGTIGRSSGYGAILPSSPSQQTPWLSVNYASIFKPTASPATMLVPVTLDPASANTVTVNYATSNNTASAGIDYTATSGTLTFSPGQTTKNISVPILPGTTPGSSLSFGVSLSSPANASIDTGTVYPEIRNPTVSPQLTIDNAAKYRPVSGSATMTFSVRLNTASPNAVSFNYATSDGSAVAGTDYLPVSGSATIAAGLTTTSITVTVKPITTPVATKYFAMTLGSVVNAFATTTTGYGYIVNDNVAPYVTVPDTALVVGASATTAKFAVTLSAASANTVTVNYATSDGSATNGTDYTSVSGTATFAPGTTTQTVSVPVPANAVTTGSRYFYLSLSSPTNAVIGSRAYGSATLLYSAVNTQLSINDTVVTRQTSGSKNASVTVTLTPASAGTVTVNYSTSDSSAVAGTDYAATSGSLTFNPGETSKTVTVPITANSASTPDRSFYISLSSASNARILRGYAYVVIVDTVAPTSGLSYASVNDSTVIAPTTGTATETFTVTLQPAATVPVRISYYTGDNDAIKGVDYTGQQGTLTFNPGQTSKTVTVPVLARPSRKADNTYTLNLRLPSGPVSFVRSSSYGAILTQAPGAVLTVGGDQSVVRGATGTQSVTFTVNLVPAQSVPVQVDYNTEDGTALDGSDYDAVSGTLTFPAGTTSRTVSVPVHGDSRALSNTYFDLNLANPVGASLANPRAYAYLDAADTFSIKGIVTDPSGAGITGVTVTRTGNGQQALSVTTGADGTYSIPNSVSGSYTVRPTGAGRSYYPTSLPATVSGGSATLNSNGAFLGYTGQVIAGKIINSVTGQVAPNATVTRSGNGQTTVSATTNAGGEYAIPTPVNGTYTMSANATGFPASIPVGLSVTVSGAANTTGSMYLVAPPFIQARVVTSGGAAVTGASVAISGPTSRTVTTNLSGYYPFSGLPPGTYTVTPTIAGHTFTPASSTVTISNGTPGVLTFTQN